LRRGALDKEGAEAVGGVVVARYGDNPLAVIKNVKKKITEITPGLPSKVHIDFSKVSAEELRQFGKDHGFVAYKSSAINQEAWLNYLRETSAGDWPQWATISQVNIVPFYDRTGLIYETLGTLYTALSEEILITIIVVVAISGLDVLYCNENFRRRCKHRSSIWYCYCYWNYGGHGNRYL
jgi:Cu(I)/Ag(I) efflux system membrane protein CusA/SilA